MDNKALDGVELEMLKASLPLMTLNELKRIIVSATEYIQANAPHNMTFEQARELMSIQYQCLESSVPLMGPYELKEFLEELKKYQSFLESQE